MPGLTPAAARKRAPQLKARRLQNRAFTLVELLVSLAILGILMALLLTALQAVREASHRIRCSNRFRQIGLAVANYEMQTGQLPPSHTLSPTRHSLLTFLLPYLDEQQVHDRYRWNEDWDAASNQQAINSDLRVFRCPSAPAGRRFTTDYAACIALQSPARKELLKRRVIRSRHSWLGVLQTTRTTSAMVLDGLSNSWLLYEDGGRPARFVNGVRTKGSVRGYAWADSQAPFAIHTTCREDAMINCKNDNEIYSFHRRGCNFLYADGSVRSINQDLAAEVLTSLLTREANDVVPSIQGLDSQ